MPAILAFLAPYMMRIILYASITAAIGGGFLYVKIHYEHIGRDAERARTETENKDASNAALAGIKNVDDCYANGGTWDSTHKPRGVCR